MLAPQALASHHRRHSGGYSSTVYADDGRSANGYSYRENDRLFKYCVACNRVRLGDILELPSRSGGIIRAVNVDHIGSRSDLDMHVRTARLVMGNLGIGRMLLHPHVIGHIDVMKSHSRHSGAKRQGGESRRRKQETEGRSRQRHHRLQAQIHRRHRLQAQIHHRHRLQAMHRALMREEAAARRKEKKLKRFKLSKYQRLRKMHRLNLRHARRYHSWR